jgi:hypothetical protein
MIQDPTLVASVPRILATGNHDYKGHRVRAMHQIEAATSLLGMNLKGDFKDKQPQPLSDAKLREAQGLLQSVLGAAEVKKQKRVTKHITGAINQINIALRHSLNRKTGSGWGAHAPRVPFSAPSRKTSDGPNVS